jgi:hypothetical protein
VSEVIEDAQLTIAADRLDSVALLTPHGVLDSKTYRSLRDGIIKAALDEPAAVIVDVTDLAVPAESAWAVFTSARWHVSTWPDIPVFLVSAHLSARNTMARNGIARYVPVYPSVPEAVEGLHSAPFSRYRRRARAQLPPGLSSLRRSRELVTEWLSAWGRADMIPPAKIVVTSLIENVLQHTHSSPCMRLETAGRTVTVAVEDSSPVQAGVRETHTSAEMSSGLRIVGALCRAWGNAPTPSGKTVWAVIGPENRL